MNLSPWRPWILAGLVGTALAIPIIHACAPGGPALAFSWETHPDLPLNPFAAGQLGVLQPSYARSYLVVAYRYLSQAPLTSAEQQSVLALWQGRLQGGVAGPSAEPRPDRTRPDWTAVRARFTREPAPAPMPWRWDETFYRPELTEHALEVAAATLQDRARRWPPSLVQAWLRAQDQVFACTGRAATVPDPASPDQPPLFQRDRAYQRACAHFYAGDFAAARAGFSALGQDAGSPWRRLGPYLAGRSWLRQGSVLLARDPAQAAACFQEADRVLAALRQQGPGPAPSGSIPEPMTEAELTEATRVAGQRAVALADPERAARALAQDLLRPGACADFGDQLGRFSNLLDANIQGESDFQARPSRPRRIPSSVLGTDLGEWVLRFQETGPEACALATRHWRQRPSLPWLLMALANAGPDSPHLQDLLAAGAALPASHPGFESVAFHRARLLVALGQTGPARALMATFLDRQPSPSPASSRNLWHALRLPLATSAEAFLTDALRVPAGLQDSASEDSPASSPVSTPRAGVQATAPAVRHLLQGLAAPAQFLEGDGARVLNRQLPTEVLLELARSPRLPVHLRREWLRAAWVRSVLLQRWDLAQAASPELIALEPSLAESLTGFASARQPELGRQALLTLLRHPGLRWMVFQGINHRTFTLPGERPLALNQRDGFLGACWWPGPGLDPDRPDPDLRSVADGWGDAFYYPAAHLEERPLFALTGGQAPACPWLSAEQRARGQEESRRLEALAAAPDWLAEQTLAWAQASPQDPRLPEALHHAVRAGKLGGRQEYGTACFRLLHRRFPGHPWTAKTRIHY